MESNTPKQFLLLAGEPILIRTIRAFAGCPAIHCIILAVATDQKRRVKKLLAEFLSAETRQKIRVTKGGATRQQSVKAGLDALPDDIKLVLVHDGARPLVSRELINACLQKTREQGAAITAIPVSDTLKQADADGLIGKTIDRSNIFRAQTPQGAQRRLLEQAYLEAEKNNFTGTDEASLLEHAGIPIFIVAGEERNIKITRPGDLRIARGLLGEESMLRIGHGFDAHRLVEGRPLIIGGETIDYPLGLLGHSDADVLSHALIDAILGALGEGDIGRHFPDTDGRYKGINSLTLLKNTIGLTKKKGYEISNADLTILCQAPKLAPHMEKMRQNLAAACETAVKTINIKATTTEKMGYTGRGEGIAAHAVVLLRVQS
jgi:2-C-methyl-D-erythritol 4-phosphate cytidylyltransferase/2-C-methyl-D-erythritol 2,4-cyclodiphosphate synthase